ncbi:MAG: molybdopterin molybdotransferase MoeA [Novosphingobium sp.]|nr:molybdopterin molybdotransferase MoeA [Novosphingobium sp.]MCP5402661.1 molybdopterin molybdotransferase MoeA [Novosphingobium sp.]
MKKPPLPLEEAQARLLSLAEPLPVEWADIPDALGRYLAEPLTARRTQPPADLSAMDGYAVVPSDMAGPWRVIGESAAGHPFEGTVSGAEAVRIATGAVMPAGADAVILQEDLQREGDRIELTGEPPSPPGKHIRRRGMDFTDGAEIMPAGTRIGPAQAALAISAGHKQLPLRRKPRLVVIDSGDELSADCEACAPHQIPASNGVMLASLAASVPAEIGRLGPVADNMDALAAVLKQAENADVIVTSGGASVGDHDLIRPALEAWGAEIDFWRVAIKPGKPILVARRGRQLILGLPGNPVSSHVTAFLFLLPVLRALLGAAEPLPSRIVTRLAEPLKPGGSRREFLRAYWNGSTIAPQMVQDSGALAALAASNALIDRNAGAPEGHAGDEVTAFLLENGGTA